MNCGIGQAMRAGVLEPRKARRRISPSLSGLQGMMSTTAPNLNIQHTHTHKRNLQEGGWMSGWMDG